MTAKHKLRDSDDGVLCTPHILTWADTASSGSGMPYQQKMMLAKGYLRLDSHCTAVTVCVSMTTITGTKFCMNCMGP